MVMEQQLSLSCKSIRIGSYEFRPQYKVLISGGSLRLIVPSVKEQGKLVTIFIENKDIIRVMANFDEKKSLIFFHLKVDACKNIREALKMKRKKHYFLDVKSSKECQKRICLVPNFLAADNADIVRSTLGNLLQEIDVKMANEIFELSKPILEVTGPSESSDENSVWKQVAAKDTKNIEFEARKQVEDHVSSNELQRLIYQKELRKLNFEVAEIVKKFLSMYYKAKKVNPKLYQITSKVEYSNMAKMFSHRFREEISRCYFEGNFSFEGIKITKEDKLNIKTAIEIHLQNRLKMNKTEFVGYSV